MKNKNAAKFISLGGILTTLAVIFQSAPIFLPGIGLVFSPLSTLPIALAAFYNIPLGITVYFASALILTLVSVQETMILLLTTGLLGMVIGTLLFRRGLFISILSSGIILSIGMTLLTYVLNISAFGDLTSSLPVSITILIFLSFSIIYSSVWNRFFRKFVNYLVKLKQID